MKKVFKIGLLIFCWIWFLLIYYGVGYRTVEANYTDISWLIGPVVSVIIWFFMRKRKQAIWIYPILLIIFLIPAIPVYFTRLNYSSVILRETLLSIFFGIIGASLLQKGIINKILPLGLMLFIFFGAVDNYGRYHDIHDKLEEEVRFEDYSLFLYKFNIMSDCEYATEWRGRKYILGNIFYDFIRIEEQPVDDSCKVRLFIRYENRYWSDKPSENRAIEYNFCNNGLSFEAEDLMENGNNIKINPAELEIRTRKLDYVDTRCIGLFNEPYSYNYYHSILVYDISHLIEDTSISSPTIRFISQPIYTDSLTLDSMLNLVGNIDLYVGKGDYNKYYFDLNFLNERVWYRQTSFKKRN